MSSACRPTKNERGTKTLSAEQAVGPMAFDCDALEPVIDAQSIMPHRDHHHSFWSIVNWEEEGGSVQGGTT